MIRGAWKRAGAILTVGLVSVAVAMAGGSALAHQGPDLHVQKVAVDDTIAAGETASFTITVRNDGVATAKQIVLTDQLPNGGLNWFENPDSPKCTITEDPNGDLLRCDGALFPGESFSVTVSAVTDADDCGILHNRAVVSDPDEPLADQADNTAEASITVECPAGGTEGCTPGFWKNHPSLWDGAGGDDVTSTVQTTDSFNATFLVTPAQSGLADSVTLLQAVNLGGGGLAALNRHAAAAAVSADSGIDYEFDLAGVVALYRDAVGAAAGPETVGSAHLKLATANERECPL